MTIDRTSSVPYYLQLADRLDVAIRHGELAAGRALRPHGFVVGETAVVEDNVSILHDVTLGGTGKTGGDRHPKVRGDVLIGAGAHILGTIEIGLGATLARQRRRDPWTDPTRHRPERGLDA